MHLASRAFLVELARHPRKNIIHYQEFCKKCGLPYDMSIPYDRKEIGRVLGEISAFEFKRDRPLLSALVVSTNFEEGDGFFKLCEELGMGSWKSLKQDPGFSAIEMNRCTNYWLDDWNYLKYKDDTSK